MYKFKSADLIEFFRIIFFFLGVLSVLFGELFYVLYFCFLCFKELFFLPLFDGVFCLILGFLVLVFHIQITLHFTNFEKDFENFLEYNFYLKKRNFKKDNKRNLKFIAVLFCGILCVLLFLEFVKNNY